MAKIPISITIEEELDNYLDKRSQQPPFRNKSHLVETAIVQFRKKEVI